MIAEAGVRDDRQYWRLSNLGILGNRGVEPDRVLRTLLEYVHDPAGDTRAAAINGLGLLGTEGTIAPLLEVLRWDKSADLRERAACNLADSGLLSHELRRKAIPELIRFGGDESLDAPRGNGRFRPYGRSPSRICRTTPPRGNGGTPAGERSKFFLELAG